VRDEVAGTLTPGLFEALTRGIIPGIRIAQFLNADEAAAICASISPYIEEYRTAPGVGRIGETMVEHREDFKAYAAWAAAWLDKWIALPAHKDLVNRTSGYLALHTGMVIKPLFLGNIPCFHGVFRKINTGAGNHVDILSADSIAFADRKILHQSSSVLHLATPPEGGETVIWERRPVEGDKAYLIDDWQYDDELFKKERKVTVPCATGDLVILPTVNYHKVLPSLPEGSDRISFSMFLVVFEDEPGTIYLYN
jgi:hypothetical protein